MALAGRAIDLCVAMELMEWGWIARAGWKWVGPLSEIGNTDPIYGTTHAACDTDAEESPWWMMDVPEKGGAATIPHYSTSIADAWLVVETMRDLGFWCVVKSPFIPGELYHAGFTPHATSGWNGRADHRGSGDTPAFAISNAALAYVADRAADAASLSLESKQGGAHG